MSIQLSDVCALLGEQDDIVILAHQKPDGDTLGSAFGLYFAVKSLGKRARVECETFPTRYNVIFGAYEPEPFEPKFVVAVDVADPMLLGLNLRTRYEGAVDLCIDHHRSNNGFAKHTYVDIGSPATAQIMYDVVLGLGAEMTPTIADALFTGISTDTGCFRYDNVTARTHEVAGLLVAAGARHGLINKLMFETKSKGRLQVDILVQSSLEYHFGEMGASVVIPEGVNEAYDVTDEELDGIASFPRKIEGVKVGMTFRQRGTDTYRVSLRTSEDVDASRIAERLGGGGHLQAAGCSVRAPSLEKAKKKVLAAVEEGLIRSGLLPPKEKPLCGILLIDKPAEFTSSDVVAVVRGMLSAKAGHAGTLDPMATGVLPVFVGRATKAVDLIQNQDKGYRATFQLGIATDTQDITGTVLEEKPFSATLVQVEQALEAFKGNIMQTPPMYSSVKIDGQRLYDLARQGKEVAREPRPVTVYEARVTALDEQAGQYQLEVLCSKGTYIRTLIHDLGQDLGCGATLTSLVRTSALGYALEECIPLREAQKLADEKVLDLRLLPVDSAFAGLTRVELSSNQIRIFANGGSLAATDVKLEGKIDCMVTVYSQEDEEFAGLGWVSGGSLKAKLLLDLNLI
ncbi:tRNA pseudouridine(55) synthase TruB [Oscillospiraceae bacterium MB08-C2-2]|nr:tRNA pseudouridine(55) synthase TruB [Oscillospiraceae bacterium MB08-C2-2]